jgi:hypothetical protein
VNVFNEPLEQVDVVEPVAPLGPPVFEREPEEAGPILARATINLRGLPAGSTRKVDPTDPYVRMCLDHGYLVPEENAWPPR